MKEKQYDHMDDRFREAAEHTELPYDDLSWQKMESLLNKEDDKRRPFLWLIPVCCVLLLGAGSLIWWNSKKGHSPVSLVEGNKPMSSVERNQEPGREQVSKEVVTGNLQDLPSETGTGSTKAPATALLSVQSGTGATTNTIQQVPVVKHQVPVTPVPVNTAGTSNIKQYNSGIKNDQLAITGNKKTRFSQNSRSKASISKGTASGDESNNNAPDSNKVDAIVKAANQPSSLDLSKNTDPVTTGKDPAIKEDTVSKNRVSKNIETDSVQLKKETNPAVASKEKDADKKQKNKKGFFVQLVGGAEVSSVKLFSFKNNPVVPTYGVGLGYRLNNKWSLQTGLYASAKKYLAGPGDYKTEPGSYLSNVNLIKIDARCMVYEIPVTVQYYFLQQKAYELYAGAGLSSYIMKKETYDYDYMYFGYPYSGKSDFTGNKSFFAVLHLKAGMEKRFGRHLSALLEPVVHIPLGGVGEGKVKLYSMGMRAGLKFNFNK